MGWPEASRAAAGDRRPAGRCARCLARNVGIMSDWRLQKEGPACLAVPISHTEDASQAGVEQRQVFRCPVEPFALRWVFVLGEGGAVSLEDVLPGVSCLLEDCFSGLRATTRTAFVAIRAIAQDRKSTRLNSSH